MRYLILVLAMVLGCAAESVEPTVQIGGYGSDIVTPDIQGTDAVQGSDVEGTDVEGTDVAQPDVQGVDVEGTDVQGVDIQVDTQPDVHADTQDAQIEVQEDVQVDVQPDVQVDKEVQADVQVDVQPDVQDVQDAQPDIQPDTQQPDVQDVQGPDVQVDVGKDTQADTKPQYECKYNTDCTDKFSCTWDHCVWGYCEHDGPKVTCDDGNDCTQDTCFPNGSCTNTILNSGSCDDGNPCTTQDLCDKLGNCHPGYVPKCEDYNDCTEDVCNTSTGECTPKALPVKTKCTGTGCLLGSCTDKGVCSNPMWLPNINHSKPSRFV